MIGDYRFFLALKYVLVSQSQDIADGINSIVSCGEGEGAALYTNPPIHLGASQSHDCPNLWCKLSPLDPWNSTAIPRTAFLSV